MKTPAMVAEGRGHNKLHQQWSEEDATQHIGCAHIVLCGILQLCRENKNDKELPSELSEQ